MENFYNISSLNPAAGAGEENLNIIKRAISEAKAKSYCGIKLPFGEYEIFSCEFMGLDHIDTSSFNCEKTEKYVSFNIDGFNDFAIRGDNTVLKFNGLTAPFNIKNCTNFKLSRITVDWTQAPCFLCDVSNHSVSDHIYEIASAIRINHSKNVTIADVTMKTVPGMGIIADEVDNLNLYRVIVKPNEEGATSVNLDSAYLTACSGTVNINTCCFEACRDVLKIHNVYKSLDLNFENSVIRNIRGRGLAVRLSNAIIRNNLFDMCNGEGVLISGGKDRNDCKPTENIEIYENRFINCGSGNNQYYTIATDIDNKGNCSFKNIKVSENEIIGANSSALIENTDTVVFNKNRIACTGDYKVLNCKNTAISDNEIVDKSDAFYFHPAVFVVENEYHIMQPAIGNYLFSVQIGNEIFNDEINGVMRSSCPVHCVKVPQGKLDKEKEYTVITRRVIERTHNTPPCAPTVNKRTYRFKPVPANNPRCYHIADSHGFIKHSIDSAKKYGDIDFLIMNGDIQCHSDEIKDFTDSYRIISELTKGEKPTILLRGNHETIGKYAEIINEYIPTDNGKTYFTARISNLWFLCLDCGGDHRDDYSGYSGTMDCHSFRLRETDFIRQVIENSKEEFDAPGVEKRIVICHIPFTSYLMGEFNREPEIYGKWQQLISDYIKPDIMIAGHMHEYSIHSDGLLFPMVVASERTADDFGGTGFAFLKDKIIFKFTSGTAEKSQEEILCK